MGIGGYAVRAVVVEGRSVSSAAREHGISRSWLYELVSRYRSEGDSGLEPRSKRPHNSPGQVSAEVDGQIVELRKTLTESGFDAGAQTIQFHLEKKLEDVPSISTIWRVLARRGFITPQPHKRPKSSYATFEASLPNECWQSDATHWRLDDGTDVEILNVIDDYSRFLVASRAFLTTKVGDVLDTFYRGADLHGYPAALLTDNAAVFTAKPRGGRSVFEAELDRLGVKAKHSRPYHPQTCGKVERFHQTLKRWLERQDRVHLPAELQLQLEEFGDYYNNIRPHRARGRITPAEAFNSKPKATPAGPLIDPPPNYRVRYDRVDKDGKLTLRHNSRLHHIGVGRRHRLKRILMLIVDLDIRVVTEDGELIRHLQLDPTRDYQPQGPV